MSMQPRSLGEEPPELPQQPISILSLPDDLLLIILARISRLHYPCLSLVSKRFRSLLSSPEIYKNRSLLGRTESCLYVCLRCSDDDPNPSWFTLCQKPSGMKMKKWARHNRTKKSSCNLLVPIPNLISPRARWAGIVALGSSIYVFGGAVEGSPSSDVWVLDCRCHTWRKAPSMRVERNYPIANVFDGKIYVSGGCRDSNWNSSNWMEVFDPKTQTWEPVLSPLAEILESSVDRSVAFEGRIFQFHMFGTNNVAYKPGEDRWEEAVGMNSLYAGCALYSHCVIDNVLYCYSHPDGLKWYNFKRQDWMKLKGLGRLRKVDGHSWIKMAGCGGKLALFWTKNVRSSGSEEMIVWCAVIVLERRNDDEILGTVEHLDPVLKVSGSFNIECVHAATA